MIKFFRRIRQKLITENRIRTYLVYALGEIVLVVIGILIALSINNWNEIRKNRHAEQELYKTLIRALESDLEDVRSKYAIIDSAIIGQETFITQSLEEVKSRFTDEEFFKLLWKIGYTSYSFVPNISIYNKISQNKEIDLIRSNELSMKIIELYEVHYWEYKDLDNYLESQAQQGLISNFFGDISHMYIEGKFNLDDSFEKHYDKLSKECRKIYFLSLSTKNSMLNCQKNIESVLTEIKNELNK